MIKSFNNKSPIIPRSCYISESANLVGDIKLGENVSVWFGSVVRGDMHYIRIGDDTNIQDNSVIHVTTKISPTIIGNQVTVGHNAIIHGAIVKDRCLIGMGSIIMDESIIGEGSIVAAGTLIPPNKIIPPKSLVMGSPYKIIRETTSKELEMIIESSEHYINFSKKYN